MSGRHTRAARRLSMAVMDGFRTIMGPGGVIVARVLTFAEGHSAMGQLLAAETQLLDAAENGLALINDLRAGKGVSDDRLNALAVQMELAIKTSGAA